MKTSQYAYKSVDPALIKPSPWNANVVSHENEEKLKASIVRHGMFKPLIVREMADGYQCLGGWHRCEQAVELGYKTVPIMNLGDISDEKAKEISLADNARYGIDDTLKLSELLADLETSVVEATMPWTSRDIAAITQSLSINIDDLDLDEPDLTEDDQEDQEPEAKTKRTHQNLRFRNTMMDAARISQLITETMKNQGFTKEDDLTNAGDALAFLLLKDDPDVTA